MAKPSSLSARGRKIVNFFQCDTSNRGDDHLGNPVSITDGERFLAEIDQEDTDLSSVIGIDGSRRIDDADSLLDGESASRSDLAFKSLRNSNRDSRGDQLSLSRDQGHFLGEGREEATPPGPFGHILRQGGRGS